MDPPHVTYQLHPIEAQSCSGHTGLKMVRVLWGEGPHDGCFSNEIQWSKISPGLNAAVNCWGMVVWYKCCMDGLRLRIIRGQAGAYLNDDKRPRARGNLRVNIPCTPEQFNEEHSFFAPGNQADGFILYNGHLDETLFQVIRNRIGPNPNHNPNTLQNPKRSLLSPPWLLSRS